MHSIFRFLCNFTPICFVQGIKIITSSVFGLFISCKIQGLLGCHIRFFAVCLLIYFFLSLCQIVFCRFFFTHFWLNCYREIFLIVIDYLFFDCFSFCVGFIIFPSVYFREAFLIFHSHLFPYAFPSNGNHAFCVFLFTFFLLHLSSSFISLMCLYWFHWMHSH